MQERCLSVGEIEAFLGSAGVEEAILGSSDFTVRSLGIGEGNNNIELNLEVDSNRDRRDLRAWFDELWNDPALADGVKAEVLQYLDQIYQNHAPEQKTKCPPCRPWSRRLTTASIASTPCPPTKSKS